MRRLLFSISIALLAGLSACSSSTEVAPPDTAIRAGSSLTFHRELTGDTLFSDVYVTDSVTYSVASVDTGLYGALDAHFIASASDTQIYRLNSAGNVELYVSEIPLSGSNFTLPASWLVLPVMTKEPVVVAFDIDSAIVINSVSGRVKTYRATGYMGEGLALINGKTYATKEVFVQNDVTVTVLGRPYTTRTRFEYGYSAELKTFVLRRKWTWSDHEFSPIPDGGEILKLVNFTL